MPLQHDVRQGSTTTSSRSLRSEASREVQVGSVSGGLSERDTAGGETSVPPARWVDHFERVHGRKPRVLHVGNIANNGYNNAKLLNEAGLDCDVICHDYYHIMGCPEWEDAPFRGEIEDQFRPDWRRVDLAGFKRPKWFAQGPLRICTRYLIARRRRRWLQAALWWWLLSQNQSRTVLWKALARLVRWGWKAYVASRRLCGAALRCVTARRWGIAWVAFGLMLACLPTRLVGLIIVLSGLAVLGGLNRRLLRKWPFPHKWPLPRKRPKDDQLPAQELIERFAGHFPDRVDQLTETDLAGYRSLKPIWGQLFQYYDLVQGYSTDPILPLLAGTRPFVAYEHGTIRDIPFEQSPVGRLTALAYASADFVFITNPDCISAARRLGIRDYCFTPHVIDHKYYASADPSRSNDSRIVFVPSRHDWATKGTDQIILGFAAFAKRHPDYRLAMTSWGQDLERSKALVREHGLTELVDFLPPMHIHGLIGKISKSRVVIDQIRGYFFGGIAPAALALGIPLVTHMESSKYAWCWGTRPPHFEAHDAETIAAALDGILDADVQSYREEASQWMKQNYHYDQVVRVHLRAYAKALGYRTPADSHGPGAQPVWSAAPKSARGGAQETEKPARKGSKGKVPLPHETLEAGVLGR